MVLTHGLVDTVEEHNDNVNLILPTKCVEILCRISAAVSSMVTQNVAPKQPKAKEESEVISKKNVKQMLKVCNTTLWTWTKCNYLVQVKL